MVCLRGENKMQGNPIVEKYTHMSKLHDFIRENVEEKNRTKVYNEVYNLVSRIVKDLTDNKI